MPAAELAASVRQGATAGFDVYQLVVAYADKAINEMVLSPQSLADGKFPTFVFVDMQVRPCSLHTKHHAIKHRQSNRIAIH